MGSQAQTAYGVPIDSEVPFPDLPYSTPSGQAIQITWFPPAEFPQGHLIAPESATLRFPGVAQFHIPSSETIEVIPDPVAHEDLIRTFLFGPAMGLLMHLRGMLVLHASCVSRRGRAVAFLGDQVWGKSTTAAAHWVDGWDFIADDVLVVRLERSDALAVPGVPWIKLWPSAIAALRLPPEEHAGRDQKTTVAVQERFSLEPVPLQAIFVLSTGALATPAKARGGQAVMELVRHTYAAELLGDTDAGPRNFEQVTKLASLVPVLTLTTPGDTEHIAGLPSLVGEALATLGDREEGP